MVFSLAVPVEAVRGPVMVLSIDYRYIQIDYKYFTGGRTLRQTPPLHANLRDCGRDNSSQRLMSHHAPPQRLMIAVRQVG
jgi:hypothetical protein